MKKIIILLVLLFNLVPNYYQGSLKFGVIVKAQTTTYGDESEDGDQCPCCGRANTGDNGNDTRCAHTFQLRGECRGYTKCGCCGEWDCQHASEPCENGQHIIGCDPCDPSCENYIDSHYVRDDNDGCTYLITCDSYQLISCSTCCCNIPGCTLNSTSCGNCTCCENPHCPGCCSSGGPSDPSDPPIVCPPGKINDGNGNCICPNGKIDDGNGGCKCPNGMVDDGRGGCINPCIAQCAAAPKCQFPGCGKLLSAIPGCNCEVCTIHCPPNNCTSPTTKDECGDCVNECNGNKPCVKYNENLTLKFHNIDADKVKQMMDKLKEDCLTGAMLSLLNGTVTFTMNSAIGGNGSFDALTNTATYKNDNMLSNPNTFAHELFHKFQQQVYGTIDDMQNSSTNEGMSNIEAETQFFLIAKAIMNDEEYSFNGKSISAMQYLVKKLMKENQSKVPTTLTNEQKKEYFKAVYAFQDYHTKVECNCPYATPLDYNIDLPRAAFEVINKMRENSNCNK